MGLKTAITKIKQRNDALNGEFIKQGGTFMISYETMLGKVEFTSGYLKKLIGHAVTSCYGVASMVPKGKQRLIDIISKKDRIDKGIILKGNINSVSIELNITVSYGMNINAIAKSIMHKVEYTVENTTGIKVDRVAVRVNGIEE